jgi:hypothetical protein
VKKAVVWGLRQTEENDGNPVRMTGDPVGIRTGHPSPEYKSEAVLLEPPFSVK